MEKYTQREIYDAIHFERKMKLALVYLNPDSPDDHVEIASRNAHLYAVKYAWYWFNNQEAFIRNAFYLIKR